MFENWKNDKLKITYLVEESKITMYWGGESAFPHPPTVLNPYFEKIIKEISSKKIFDTIFIDFSMLSFMNSGTVPPIINLLKGLNSIGKDIIIIYDKKTKWQSLAFQGLRAVTTVLKNVRID